MDGICISCIMKFLYLGFTIIYAMGWNVPSTVWLNHHTCHHTKSPMFFKITLQIDL